MTLDEYKIIRVFLNQTCGIVLGENKQYLVNSRLSGLLVKFNFSSFSELVVAIQMDSSKSLKVKTAVIDAMTTNETFWFRDDLQFIELKEKIFPELLEKKRGTIKIWSAACSSGQEPYSISMCAEDTFKQIGKKRDLEIIGTDISETILMEAKSATYTDMSLSRGLDTFTKKRFFQKTHAGYKLNTEITDKVRFQQFNLLKPFTVLGRFNVIFCRNVLIYFSDSCKRDILTRMMDSLEVGGVLFLSSTESMPLNMEKFEKQRNGRIQYFKKIV